MSDDSLDLVVDPPPRRASRFTSVNPGFAARRIERTLAVWVKSTTGSPGRSPANQPRTIHGLVLCESLHAQLGLGDNYVEFQPGYLWTP